MRIAIVDDIETERALLKMRLERQLSLYGVETAVSYTHLTLPTICSV